MDNHDECSIPHERCASSVSKPRHVWRMGSRTRSHGTEPRGTPRPSGRDDGGSPPAPAADRRGSRLMDVAIVTGSAGLIGAETVRFFSGKGLVVVGIDNDMRRVLFGDEASTAWSRDRLLREVPGYVHRDDDIRD